MTLCIVGINGFQAYWLYETWLLSREQFGRDVREALFVVGQREQEAFTRFLTVEMTRQPEISTKKVRVLTVDLLRYPSQEPELAESNPAAGITVRRFKTNSSVPLHGLDYTKRIIDRWPLSLPKLARAYQAELRLRGVNAGFLLDTLRLIPSQQYQLSDSIQFRIALDSLPGPGETQVIRLRPAGKARKPDSVIQRRGRPLQAADQAKSSGPDVQTPPVPLLLIRDLYIQARFPAPTFYILQRMAGPLIGSVLLLALTTGCFWLMLSTILKQKKLSEVKNDFINNMTHELKTPLATVSAAVEALQNFGALNNPTKTQAYLRISRTELQRLSDLVEKVLNIAVDERQQLQLTPEPVQPAELVAEIVARHQLQAAKPVKFDVEVAPAASVRFDKLHMGNVINNLIDNAIKYSKEAVTITIRGRQEPTGWHLTVADDGPGIEPGYQQAIFDQFFRVPTGNLHNVKGFGLGLYYVRQVVERHGGHIGVRSSLGRGSEFALWIPQA